MTDRVAEQGHRIIGAAGGQKQDRREWASIIQVVDEAKTELEQRTQKDYADLEPQREALGGCFESASRGDLTPRPPLPSPSPPTPGEGAPPPKAMKTGGLGVPPLPAGGGREMGEGARG